jgi:hypothetical protein
MRLRGLAFGWVGRCRGRRPEFRMAEFRRLGLRIITTENTECTEGLRLAGMKPVPAPKINSDAPRDSGPAASSLRDGLKPLAADRVCPASAPRSPKEKGAGCLQFCPPGGES